MLIVCGESKFHLWLGVGVHGPDSLTMADLCLLCTLKAFWGVFQRPLCSQDHSDFGMFGGANIILVVLLNCVSFGNEISGSSRVEKKRLKSM
jgi:hypothetical protein